MPRTLGIDVVFAEHQYALAHAEEFLYDTTGSSRDVDLPKFEPRIPDLTRKMVAADVWVMPMSFRASRRTTSCRSSSTPA